MSQLPAPLDLVPPATARPPSASATTELAHSLSPAPYVRSHTTLGASPAAAGAAISARASAISAAPMSDLRRRLK